jgi:hypothetical protein
VAQTKQVASFGPVLVAATFHLHLHHVLRRIHAVFTIKILSYNEEILKNRTFGPNVASFVPVFFTVAFHISLPPLIPSFGPVRRCHHCGSRTVHV